MPGHGEKMTKKQDEAVLALLTETSIKAAAKKVGINEVTLWRWTQNADFMALYHATKKRITDHAISQIQAACSEAVATLRDIMSDVTAPAQSRVGAARTVLEIALKAREVDDVEARLKQLEESYYSPLRSVK